MASHSTRVDSRLGARSREAEPTTGPRRMTLSERMDAGESPLDHARGDPEPVEGSKGKTPAPVTAPCFVYILKCSDGSFYVGSTSDVAERERIHNEGHGAAHTAAHGPVRLVYSEAHESWPAARKREAQLKRWTRAKKDALVARDRSTLHDLARRRRG